MRILLLIFLSTPFFLSSFVSAKNEALSNNSNNWWDVQSVDTMKYSRDPSRELLGDSQRSRQVITQQVSNVAGVGATHIAISTPYDDEFLPLLEEWVAEARLHGLKVWFRGNWSGWEGWFGYSAISPEQHLEKTTQFIKDNADLFEDGDIFSSCPECENGGPGDPRFNNRKLAHQQFLIKQHQAAQAAFSAIDKEVETGYHSMNGDVAKLVMDTATTKDSGGYIVVDHYVRTPEQLVKDVANYGIQSGGKVVLGEFGAPIPDIHGSMTQQQQAEWLEDTLSGLADSGALYGLNYWTGMGGSTALWNEDGTPRAAVEVLSKYYKPAVLQGVVRDTLGRPVAGVTVTSQNKQTVTDKDGVFVLPYLEKEGNLIFTAENYFEQLQPFAEVESGVQIVLEPKEVTFKDRALQRLQQFWSWVSQLLVR